MGKFKPEAFIRASVSEGFKLIAFDAANQQNHCWL